MPQRNEKMSDELSMVPSSDCDISSLLSIADESVGKNLYTVKDFEAALGSENSFLFLLKNGDGEIAVRKYIIKNFKEKADET